MLVIRQEQLDVLTLAAAKSFEDRMVAHLQTFFAEECRRGGDARVRAAIRQGIFRAAKYGMTSELDVARYIDLSVVLGLSFDTKPWAAEILNDSQRTPLKKLVDLHIVVQNRAAGGSTTGRVTGPARPAAPPPLSSTSGPAALLPPLPSDPRAGREGADG